MTRYRPHRGGLAESRYEEIGVSTLEELAEYLVPQWGNGPIEVVPYGFDDRTGWDTHIVKVDGVPVGFTDGPLHESKSKPRLDGG